MVCKTGTMHATPSMICTGLLYGQRSLALGETSQMFATSMIASVVISESPHTHER